MVGTPFLFFLPDAQAKTHIAGQLNPFRRVRQKRLSNTLKKELKLLCRIQKACLFSLGMFVAPQVEVDFTNDIISQR